MLLLMVLKALLMLLLDRADACMRREGETCYV
jgi:hypothetical protein